jgi:hypothetical protein
MMAPCKRSAGSANAVVAASAPPATEEVDVARGVGRKAGG